MSNTEALNVYALKHTVHVVKAALSPDPDDALRNAYLALATQRLSDRDVAWVTDAALGNVLGILRELLPEGIHRQNLISRLEAVGSYAELLETVNNLSRSGNRAARRKNGRRKK